MLLKEISIVRVKRNVSSAADFPNVSENIGAEILNNLNSADGGEKKKE